MKYFIILYFLFLITAVAQSKDSINKKLNFPQKSDSTTTLKIKPDTTAKNFPMYPILKLRSELSLLNLYTKNFLMFDYDNSKFITEEKQSGLSKNQLTAYLKNKEALRKILISDYEERWWYRIKGIEELWGVPNEVIWMLEFALMYLL